MLCQLRGPGAYKKQARPGASGFYVLAVSLFRWWGFIPVLCAQFVAVCSARVIMSALPHCQYGNDAVVDTFKYHAYAPFPVTRVNVHIGAYKGINAASSSEDPAREHSRLLQCTYYHTASVSYCRAKWGLCELSWKLLCWSKSLLYTTEHEAFLTGYMIGNEVRNIVRLQQYNIDTIYIWFLPYTEYVYVHLSLYTVYI